MENNPRELHSDRLLLRPVSCEDIDVIYLGLSDPKVIKYYGVSFDSLEATEWQMKWYLDLEKFGTGIWWVVCHRFSGDFLGACGFNNLKKEHRKAEIGLWLLPNHWGKGIMQEVLPLIIQYGFNKMNLHRIEGYVESENQSCQHSLFKLGFKHEGTMIDCELKNGAYISIDIYALVNGK